MPPAGRPAVRQPQRQARERVRRQQRPLSRLRQQGRKRLHVQLHVGPRQARIGAEKPAAVVDRLRQGPAAGQQILRPHHHLAPPGPQDVVVCRHLHRPGVVDPLMIAQMIANVRVVDHHRHPQPRQQPPRPDPRQLQQLRRVDRPPRQNDLTRAAQHLRDTAAQILHPDGPLPFQDHPRHLRPGDHFQIAAPHRRPQKRPRCRIAPASLDGHLIGAGPLLLGAVEIGVERQACLPAGRDVVRHQRMQPASVFRDEQRPARAAPVIAARLAVLDRLVGGAAFLPAPARIVRPPFGVIVAVSPDPDHGVDAGRPAQHLAPRPEIRLPVQPGVWLGPVAPVDGGVVEQLAVAKRHLHEEPPVAAPGLDQRHPVLAGRGQPLRQNAAGRACPHDDVIRPRHCAPQLHPRPQPQNPDQTSLLPRTLQTNRSATGHVGFGADRLRSGRVGNIAHPTFPSTPAPASPQTPSRLPADPRSNTTGPPSAAAAWSPGSARPESAAPRLRAPLP